MTGGPGQPHMLPTPIHSAPEGAPEPPQTDDVGEALRLLKNLEVGRALGRRLKELEATVATLQQEAVANQQRWDELLDEREQQIATLTAERDALKQFKEDDERNVGKIVDALADAELEVCPTHTEANFVCPECYEIERAAVRAGGVPRLAELVKAMEWAAVDEHVHGCCPLCLNFPSEGHETDCTMKQAAELAAVRAGGVSAEPKK
jgi:DNA repair exonuclease SbcCD ATPase subunit